MGISAPGTLTIGHATVDVVASLHVQRTADGLEVAGALPVTLADLGLPTPDPGFVTVDPTGVGGVPRAAHPLSSALRAPGGPALSAAWSRTPCG